MAPGKGKKGWNINGAGLELVDAGAPGELKGRETDSGEELEASEAGESVTRISGL